MGDHPADLILLIGLMGALMAGVAVIETVWRVLRTAALALWAEPLRVSTLRASISSRGEIA